MAAELIFSHPKVHPNLTVKVKPTQIAWSYGLNTANYPTYGGEVIQILSCFIEDMTVTGQIRSYNTLETIYAWFIDYIQIATTGKKGHGSFNPQPVIMQYPHRGWQFEIIPKSMPSFKYGRDIVAPEWTLQAAVADPDQDLKLHILDQAAQTLIETEGKLKLFGTVTGDIGFTQDDPFRSPIDSKQNDKLLKQGQEQSQRPEYGELADNFNKLIPAYLGGDFHDLSADYSKPTYVGGTNKGTSDAQNIVKPKK